jgi:hypothetical protein
MNLEEWIAYNDNKEKKRCHVPRGKERDHPASVFLGDSNIVLDEENGVFQYSVIDDTLYLTGIIGNFAVLEKRIIDIAQQNRCKRILAYSCTKKPETLERLFKSKIARVWYEYEREVL